MLPYWTVEVAKLEVIQPDGRTVPVDVAANSKESIDTSQMAENIYDPNNRVLSVNIPQLSVGDVVHVVAREVIHRSIMPDEFDDENIFEGASYIRHWSYVVHAPTNLPLVSIGLRDEIPGTITSSTQTNGSSMVYNWEVTNVPRMFDEPGMPPYDQVLQRLFVSTVPAWQDVSKWYWNLSLPHLEKFTPEMQQTNAILIANQPTDLDKVKALFYYVSKNIRYMGLTPEKDRPGFEPHDVSLTFEKKYGVCRDKAGSARGNAPARGIQGLSGADQHRRETRPARAAAGFQPRDRLRGIEAGRIHADGPDRRKHARPAAVV